MTFGRGVLIAGFVSALAASLWLDANLDTSVLEYEVSGNGCQRLTGEGREDFEAAVLGLQLTLLAWMLIGAGALTRGWRRRLGHAPGWPAVLGGWLLGVGGAGVLAWFGPTLDGLGKAFMLVLYAPAVLLVCAAIMLAGLLHRRAGSRPPVPVGLLLASLSLLAFVQLAGVILGGSDEILSC